MHGTVIPPRPPGYSDFGDIPQRGSIAKIARGTGYPELDDLFKFYPEQLVLVSGYTGHGKSTFMLNVIAKQAVDKKVGSFLYVPENEGSIIEKVRLLWPGNDVQWGRFCHGLCSIQSAVPQGYHDPYHTIDWALERSEYAVVHEKRELIFLDPWNELDRNNKPKDQLMTDYIGDSLMLVKQFCRQFKVTVIIAVHPTKMAMQAGRPMNLADIEGSMNWGNKSDNVLIVSRNLNTAKITSAKVREIGAGERGECQFTVDRYTGKFTPVPGSTILDV
jgi:hypothetical protein